MSDQTIDFAAFFRAVHGVAPFPWQARLADTVASSGWPPVLDLPTGVGKTAAIDVAVWHLATAAPNRAPRRIFFVVDRRIVVDAAYERASRLAHALRRADAAGDPILYQVATRLRKLTGEEDAPPLEVARLRGGAPRSPDWARSPAQPLVAVSTVDQIGSRLLFRGYGLSDSRLPFDAALVGTDALILLDEAHLSEPFRQTLTRLDSLRGTERVAGRSWSHVTLSATPGRGEAPAFTLHDDDRSNEVLARRLSATKLARLQTVKGDRAALERAIAAAAERQSAAGEGTAHALLVIVNRVASARAIHADLSRRLERAQVHLAIGRSRPYDRDLRVRDWIHLLRAGRDDGNAQRNGGDGPVIVVGTQSLEAGADLDADALVTESAALDALRQRFGRLDRLGRLPATDAIRADIVHLATRDDDPIYGPAIGTTWKWLDEHAVTIGRGSAKVRVIDFGVDAITEALARTEGGTEALQAPKPDAPLLLPEFLDAWTQTSPPGLCPSPALFLHGPSGVSPASVVWRADVDLDDQTFPSLRTLPPSSLEAIELPIRDVRRWLTREPGAEHGDESLADVDVDSSGAAYRDDEQRRSTRYVCVRRDAEGEWHRAAVTAIRPGDLIVVPASAGGCDRWGWNPESTMEVEDIAEASALQQRGRFVLRVHPQLPQGSGARDWTRTAAILRDHPDDPPSLLDQLAAMYGIDDEHRPRLQVAGWYAPDDPERGIIIASTQVASGLVLATTEDDQDASADEAITLGDHQALVRRWAERFADALALPPEARDALVMAAEHHDLGKCDAAFQGMIRRETMLSRFDGRPLLAKSRGPFVPWASGRAGMPSGWRHEVLSVVLAEPLMHELPQETRALALWLIGTHHGRGRPTFDAFRPSPSPAAGVRIHQQLTLQRPAGVTADDILADHVERGATLRDRHGAYGLAQLELILRAADHRASAAGGAA